MTLEEKIKTIHELKTAVTSAETSKKELEAIIKQNNDRISILTSELLNDLDEAKLEEYVVDDLVAYVAVNSSTGYTDESAVLKYLEDNKYTDFIKTTVAIKKKELNAELKKNAALKEDIDKFITTVKTRYATVSTKENNDKRLAHIAESKERK